MNISNIALQLLVGTAHTCTCIRITWKAQLLHHTISVSFSGISSLAELAEQRGIRYGTVANSAPQLFFDSQNAEPYAKMAKFMESEQTSVPNASEAIRLVNESYGKSGNV